MVVSMSPSVLFVDEIDKGLGGAGSGGGDSGTSLRVLGTYLTWLQELKAPVFNVVTANRVTGLPPELLRRGRFDQIFSVVLPSPKERKEVLDIHLLRRGQDIHKFSAQEVATFVAASDGFVAAEIEAAVKDSLIAAFSSGKKLAMTHLLTALREIIPMSKSHAAQIDEIVRWATDNAISVSYPEDNEAVEAPTGVQTRRILSTRKAVSK
jgi:SpoVK/Ycf46/Vps4 family AAA+-type ATPase